MSVCDSEFRCTKEPTVQQGNEADTEARIGVLSHSLGSAVRNKRHMQKSARQVHVDKQQSHSGVTEQKRSGLRAGDKLFLP